MGTDENYAVDAADIQRVGGRHHYRRRRPCAPAQPPASPPFGMGFTGRLYQVWRATRGSISKGTKGRDRDRPKGRETAKDEDVQTPRRDTLYSQEFGERNGIEPRDTGSRLVCTGKPPTGNESRPAVFDP